MVRDSALLFCLTAGLLSAQLGGPGARPAPGRGNPQNPQRPGLQNGQQNAQPQPAPINPEDLGSIHGQILNAVTGEPMKRASVSLRRLDSRGQPVAGATDAVGQFSLTGIEPGRYRLFAERNGFVRQEYGARGPERTGTTLTLDKAQRLNGLAIRLTPQAVITGRILDEDGEPVRGVNIQAMRT